MTRCVALMAMLIIGYAAQGADCSHDAETLRIEGATICLQIDGQPAAQHALLEEWVRRSAHIVSSYYGRFPAGSLILSIGAMDKDGVGGGRTTSDPLRIQVRVGRNASRENLAQDWVLVHEMVHLALPELGRSHNWLAEGLAVYVEGIARAQAGNRAVADVWAEDRHSMPAGLPRSGEGGMDQTASWGRTYWGGALFCLQADIAIRQATANRVGLQTALRAILSQTGGYEYDRSIAEVLKIGDTATGSRSLEDLYERMRTAPLMTDLDALWGQLGVPVDPMHQPFDEQAPLAAVRAAITARP